MAKRKVDLAVITAAAQDVKPLERDNVSTLSEPKPDTRRPHVSLYLPKAVQKEIKLIAIGGDRKPHDVYIEAIDLLLKHHGRPSGAELKDAN